MSGRPQNRRQSIPSIVAAASLLATVLTVTSAPTASAAVFDRPTNSSPIALSRNDSIVFVVNPGNDTLSVLCAANGDVLATIGVGDEPQSVAVDPDNKFIFVANAAGSSVTTIKIINATCGGWAAAVDKTIVTGAEPWNIVISPDGKRVFVANSSQDTITVIDAAKRKKIGDVDLRDSLCNDPERRRHFQPRGLAVTQDNSSLYVTRFLSFTKPGGQQGRDNGKEGLVCRLDIDTNSSNINGYQPAEAITFANRPTGFAVDSNGDGTPDETRAWPNQMQSVVIRGDKAFMPNIAASPQGPLVFNNSTQAFVTILDGVGTGNQSDGGAINLHLGARNPEPDKKRLFFANPWAIAFTSQTGRGNAYVVSAGSDLLVKLDVSSGNKLSFTVDDDTTRYIDLNDPEVGATRDEKAGKNPQGLAINSDGNRAWVMNFVSGNVSVVNLKQDKVIDVIQTAPPPVSGSLEEKILVGAEMFFSSRGHFNRPGGTTVSTDERLSSEGWQNCASCHFKGWTDGVIWSFASGPRKSVNLGGTFNPHDRNEQKVLNYSAIFDEVQDFEANIRNISGPGNLPAPVDCKLPPPDQSAFNPNQGLLIGDNGDIDFPPCVINSLAKPNAGRKEVTVDPVGATPSVKALTALKQWVQNAVRVPNGPLDSDELEGGVPAEDIEAGRTLFKQQKCTSCHGGGLWSKSVKDFDSPPEGKDITCEVNLAAAAPPGSRCLKAPVIGDPTNVQYLNRFLEEVGSFNAGVPGQGNPIGGVEVGADEKAAPVLVGGVSQAPKDALGIDYNDDNRGIGFNPQSLLGIHTVQPYLHNGACETLTCVIADAKHRTGNGRFPDVIDDATERAQLVRFLESIDADTNPFD
jgi:YVTN family beta-propeller protein